MKIAFINAYDELNRNQSMFYSTSRLGIDLFACVRQVAERLRKLGHMVFSPYNFSAATNADIAIFLDRPRREIQHYGDLLRFCNRTIMVDSELDHWLEPDAHDFKCNLHLTYKRSLWNGQDVLPFNSYAVDVRKLIEFDPQQIFERAAGFTMLATNHTRNFEGELYSLRREGVEFFGKHSPELLTLGGLGWDGFDIRSEGLIEDKAEFIRRRQFNFCFENCSQVSGYITEKLLESILCGCIPIYCSIGHDNGLVPSGVYINAGEFESWEALVAYCLALTDADKLKIVREGKKWLSSEEAAVFQLESAVETLTKAVLSA